MARAMLIEPGMKDVAFLMVTVAFFAVTWLYAKSFDRL